MLLAGTAQYRLRRTILGRVASRQVARVLRRPWLTSHRTPRCRALRAWCWDQILCPPKCEFPQRSCANAQVCQLHREFGYSLSFATRLLGQEVKCATLGNEGQRARGEGWPPSAGP